jgi:tetratricopeptide (TPR) repeat protein
MARPYISEGYALRHAKKYERSQQLLLGASERSTAPQAFEQLASTLLDFQEVPERWNIVVYLLEDSRFQVPSPWASQELGMDLRKLAADPRWSATVLERHLAVDPSDGFGHLLLGRAYAKDRKASQAEQQFLLAAKDPEQRSGALAMLYELALRQCEHDKARRYFSMVKKEFPDDIAKYHMEEP